jgi:hypothetical protein
VQILAWLFGAKLLGPNVPVALMAVSLLRALD